MNYNKFLLFCLLCICIATAKLSAQKISLNVQEAHLVKIFSSITNQTGLTFAYSPSIINLDKKISILIKDTELPEVLDLLFSDTDIHYEIGKDKIYLNKKNKTTNDKPSENTISVSGFVTDELKDVLIGATIIQKGTTNGTVTGWNGEYTLEVNPNDTLIVSYIGYITEEIPVTNQSTINIKLIEETKILDELIVTALGIQKKEKSLSYSIQQIEGAEFTQAKDNNFINSLAGKASNVIIHRNSSGVCASSRVIIRGLRSTVKDNQPLYVLDGIPILNTNSEHASTAIGGTANAGNRDGGDGISNLNAEDIAGITILKGSSASALYGSQAANGVILITTKKGIKGVREIRFSSGVTFDNAISLPEFQNNYSQVENSTNNWGERANLTRYDNLNDFFQTGISTFNSLVLTSGTDKIQSYFSYANTQATGIIDNNKMTRHNLNIRQTIRFFNNRLTIDPNINFISQNITNKPVSGGYYMNPLVGLYTFPRGKNIREYRDHYELYDPNRNMYTQNWYTPVDGGFEQNPYWLKNRTQSNDKRLRAIISTKAELKIAECFRIQARGSVDFLHDRFKQKIHASTSNALAGINGRYIDFFNQDFLLYGDILGIVSKKIENFEINFVVGASIEDYRTNILRYDSGSASLYYPNVFTIANIRMTTDAYIDERDEHEQSQSLFSSFQIGYNNIIYVDITARNEWSSTLAFTNSKKNGFFYPSVGSTWLVSNSFNMPECISLGKIRSSWSKTGTGIAYGASNPMSHIGAGGKYQETYASSYFELQPVMSNSLEAGTEWRFIKHRISFDFTLYKTNTKNQFFSLPTTPGLASVKDYNVNSGDIENKGVEITFGATPVLTKNFTWTTFINYSRNKNTILELHDDLNEYSYGTEGISTSYKMALKKGGSFGDIYGKAFDRDENGNIIYTAEGLPSVTESGNIHKVGNCNPDFTMGWSNTFKYKNFSLYFLLDGQFGGKMLSQTQAELDYRGVSKITGDARDRGFVNLEGTNITKIEDFYLIVGGRNGVTEYYMYDATNIRLRELVLYFDFPEKLMSKISFIKNIQLSLTGRNMFFLYKKIPFDPDATLSTANDNQGIDVFGAPMTRSFGFNVRFTF